MISPAAMAEGGGQGLPSEKSGAGDAGEGSPPRILNSGVAGKMGRSYASVASLPKVAEDQAKKGDVSPKATASKRPASPLEEVGSGCGARVAEDGDVRARPKAGKKQKEKEKESEPEPAARVSSGKESESVAAAAVKISKTKGERSGAGERQESPMGQKEVEDEGPTPMQADDVEAAEKAAKALAEELKEEEAKQGEVEEARLRDWESEGSGSDREKSRSPVQEPASRVRERHPREVAEDGMREEMRELGRDLIEVPGDGSCLLYAFMGTRDRVVAMAFRVKVLKWLMDNLKTKDGEVEIHNLLELRGGSYNHYRPLNAYLPPRAVWLAASALLKTKFVVMWLERRVFPIKEMGKVTGIEKRWVIEWWGKRKAEIKPQDRVVIFNGWRRRATPQEVAERKVIWMPTGHAYGTRPAKERPAGPTTATKSIPAATALPEVREKGGARQEKGTVAAPNKGAPAAGGSAAANKGAPAAGGSAAAAGQPKLTVFYCHMGNQDADPAAPAKCEHCARTADDLCEHISTAHKEQAKLLTAPQLKSRRMRHCKKCGVVWAEERASKCVCPPEPKKLSDCPVKDCTVKGATTPQLANHLRSQHGPEHWPDDKALLALGIRKCRGCNQPYPRQGQHEKACEKAKVPEARAQAKFVEVEMEKKDWDFLDTINLQDLATWEIPTRTLWPASASLGGAMAASMTQLLEGIAKVTNRKGSAEFTRQYKLLSLLPGWMMHMNGPVLRDRDVAKRWRRFQNGEWQRLHQDMLARKRGWGNQSIVAKYRRVIAMVRRGNISKANKILQSEATVMEVDDGNVNEVLKKFRVVTNSADVDLHPPEEDLVDDDPDRKEKFAQAVDKAIYNLKNGTAAGRTGWRNEHIKGMQKVHPNFVQALASVLDAWSDGNIPREMAELQAGGRITPLLEGTKVRPIVAQETFVRIMASAVGDLERQVIKDKVGECQFGVGVKDGMDIMRTAMDFAMQKNPGWVGVKIDIAGAYDNVDRWKISQLLRDCPKLARMFAFSYGHTNLLTLRMKNQEVKKVLTDRGVLQGDSLAPAYWSVAIAEAMRKAKEAVPMGLVVGWLDDVFIVGPPTEAQVAYTEFTKEAALVGATVNVAKLSVLTQADTVPQFVGGPLERVPLAKAINVVGVPVGDKKACEDLVNKKVEERMKEMEVLKKLGHTQTEFLILKYCLLTQMVHIIRGMPPDVSLKCATVHDDNVLKSVEHMVEEALTRRAEKATVQLPECEGGMGLRSMRRMRPAAFLAARSAFFSSVKTYFPSLYSQVAEWLAAEKASEPMWHDMQGAMKELKEAWEKIPEKKREGMKELPRKLTDLLDKKFLQGDMGVALTRADVQELENNMNERDRTRFASQRCPLALKFLSAVPVVPDLQWENEEFKIRLRTLCGKTEKFAKAGTLLGSDQLLTDHSFTTTNRGGVKQYRHEQLKHKIAFFANRANLQTRTTTKIAFSQSATRPDGITTMSDGSRVAWDVTICNAYVKGGQLKGVDEANRIKHDTYDLQCQLDCMKLCAVSVDHLGGMSTEAMDFLRTIAYVTTQQDAPGVWGVTAGEHVLQRVSAVLAKEPIRAALHLRDGLTRYNRASGGWW